MNSHVPNPDTVRLQRIAARWDAATADGALAYGDGEPRLMAGETHILTFSPEAGHDNAQFYFHAHPDIGFLLTMIERARRRVNELLQQLDAGKKNFSAECAMKCEVPAFRVFLTERHGLTANASDDATIACVRKALDIKSRKELNSSKAAADRWKRLRDEFDEWSKRG